MTRIVDDDEAEIEAEIQRELDEISADNLEIEDLEDISSSFEINEKDENPLPESIEEYLKFVQSRSEFIQQEVQECDDILLKDPLGNQKDEDQILAQKIKEALGEDCHDNPLEIRNKVLSEIEKAEEQEEQDKLRRASQENNMAFDIIRPGISDEVRLLEETAEKQLHDLEEKQSKKNQQRIEMYEKMKREENARLEKEQNARKLRQKELEEAQKRLNENQKMLQAKIEEEKKQEEQEFNLLEQKFQEEIKELEIEKEKEKKALEQIKLQEEEYQRIKKNKAAITIQKTFRGQRVYKQHKEILDSKKNERFLKWEEELEKQYREEIDRKEAEERKKKELQEKKRIEEERMIKEEQWEKEMKEKKRKEEEEEKKRKEQEEKKKKEAEKKRKEQEDKKREEEKKLREGKRKEEERQKELEALERKKIEEEEKRKEEERKKLEELKKQKEQEERSKEEEKRKEELKKEEMKKREMEQKRKEEQARIEEEKKAELERKKREKEREDKQKIEAEIQKQNELKLKENEKSDKKQRKHGEETSECRLTSTDLVNLEERRKKWLKEHVSWSMQTTCEDRVQPIAKSKARQRPRRPFSASKSLPQLTKEQILQASLPGTSLHKVVRVSLSSCPACNMHGLDGCSSLKTLTMTDCGLLAAEGLDDCKQLQELRLQDNKIEYVNIKDLCQLEDMQLNNNNLASAQGITNCTQLKNLDLRNNRITRIGDLSTCPNLQILNLDNNQLITTKGLSHLAKLQSLSCTNNHLPNVKEIDSCQLLQMLNLTGNNLQKPPSLTNHVLLRELILDDNSISTLESFADVWLPSLRVLSVSQNSISNIDCLGGLIMLYSLDIRFNLISDLDSLLPGLCGCKELSVLKIAGNPVNEEPRCRDTVVDKLLLLTELDDEKLHPKTSSLISSASPFMAMCHKQLQEYSEMKSKYKEQLSVTDDNTQDPSKVISRLQLKSQQFNEVYQQAVAHLLQHENFGMEQPDVKLTEALQEKRTVDVDRESVDDTTSAKTEKKTAFEKVCLHGQRRKVINERTRTEAAVKIQSLWRGWHIRHLIDVQTKRWLAAVTIQSTWRGYSVRSRVKQKSPVSRARKALWDIRHDAAATTIQACYRGYRVRRILTQALQTVKDDSDDDDFNYDEEVDLSAFDFDSGVLDDGWTPTDTPQLPSRGPALPKTGQSGIQSKPRQAWRSADSPMEPNQPTNQHRVNRVPGINLNRSPEQDLMSVTSGTQSHLTHRAEEMSNEWGLKDVSTAELMWKRANRMKYNPARKRKMLDPSKRLALFKKLDEANKLKEVKPPPKRQPRVDYFAAREANMLPSGTTTPTSEREAKAQMTYSWVHSQGVVHEDQESSYMGFTQDYSTKQKKQTRSSSLTSKSSVSLPQLDPVQLAGRPIPLVSSPALIREQMSKESTPRRTSSISEDVHFPPIKTYSVPNLAARSVQARSSSRPNEKSNSAGARMTNERREQR